MNWFKVTILNRNTEDVIFELPIRAPMQNSVEGRFEEFIERNPEYKELIESIGEYTLRSEHIHHLLSVHQQTED